MPTHEPKNEITAEEAWDLIPWYVNSTLSTQENEAVERLLARDPVLRAEVAAQTRLAEKVTALDSLDVELERSLGAMRQRITAEGPNAGPPRTGRILTVIRGLAERARFDLRVLLPLGAAVASIALVLAVLPAQRDATYTTLTAPAAPVDGTQFRIKAAENAGEAELRQVFAKYGLRVVDGPTAAGVYTLAMTVDHDAALVAERLQAAPEIEFATVRPRP